MQRYDLNDVYKDFFEATLDINDFLNKQENGEAATMPTETVPEEKLDYNDEVDKLYLDETSKTLLKKIIKYMESYHAKEVDNYINFNIKVNNEYISKDVAELLSKAVKTYHYIDNSTVSVNSLIKIDEIDKLIKLYKEDGIIVFNDLDGINMHDDNFKKKFVYYMMEGLEKRITIVADKEDRLKLFFQLDDELNNRFLFELKYEKPELNDVYQRVLDSTNNLNLEDEFKVKLLDYITETYPKSTKDPLDYINILINHISFNKDVPELEKLKPIDEIFKDLNELVGLEKVKKSLKDLVDLISLKNKTKDELKLGNINLHMVFLGNPGTGKTTVARMICGILYDLKYIRQNKLIEVSSKDLVAEYVGQTAPKTMSVVDRAMGGVLFIDEAYALQDKKGDNQYNAEAIATLIKAMEDYRDDLVVIFAGYTKEMQDFLDSNSGIVSRIGYTLEFDDYTKEELSQIFLGMVKKAGFECNDDALKEFEKLVDQYKDTKNFGNARFARNVYEKTIIKHATNTKNAKKKSILKTITKNDIDY